MSSTKQESEIKEVLQEVTGLENNKIWNTLRGLTLNPGKEIRNYCQGPSQRLLNPVAYFFLVFALCTWVGGISGLKPEIERLGQIEILQFFKELNLEISSESVESAARSNRFLDSETANSLLLLPLTVILRWLIFRRIIGSFRSNAWFELYTGAQIFLFTVFAETAVWLLSGQVVQAIFEVAGLTYLIWATIGFYEVKLTRAILLNIVYAGASLILLMLVSFVSGGIFTLLRHVGM